MQTIYAWTVVSLLISTVKAFQGSTVAKLSFSSNRASPCCARRNSARLLPPTRLSFPTASLTTIPRAFQGSQRLKYLDIHYRISAQNSFTSQLFMSSTSSVASSSRSWGDLQDLSNAQAIGAALNNEMEIRKVGNGSAHVQSKLRLFGSKTQPKITLYRDHAGEF
jgi:hypothetical protein